MPRSLRTWGTAGLVGLPLAVITLHGLPARHQPYSTWSDYGGSADSMQYSSLTQIDRKNVGQLELAWFYPVPDRQGTMQPFPTHPRSFAMRFTLP